MKNLTLFILVSLAALATTTTGCRKERTDILPPVVYSDSNQAMARSKEIFMSPLLGDGTTAMLLVIDTNGDTIKAHYPGKLVGDFRRWDIAGKCYYSYLEENKGFYIIPQIAIIAGYRVITDSNFNELKRITLLSYAGINGQQQPASEVHDFLMLGENHFINLAYYEHTPANIAPALNPATGVKVATPVIQEIVNDKVVWQWVGSDYPELYEVSIEGNDYSNTTKTCDYLHVNSMFVDPNDGNLIVSCRNGNQLLKLNRKGSGIIWKMGGKHSDFEIPAGMQFLRQHFATVINGHTIMLLDNGDINERNFSRVMEYDIDEDNRKITATRAYNIPGDFIRFAGSVQKFGDNYFIGGGFSGYALEVNSRTNVKKFEMKIPRGSYRAYKYP